MKKVLILGANSYIGNSFQKYIGENYNDQYEVHKVSLRGEAWKEDDWSGYDSILNVTGKAHADIGILTEEQKQEYYAVNCDLACEAAQKAVKDGVGQYIYLSSVIVYGDSSNGGGAIHITKDTKPAPSNFYGDSKWQAEQKLQVLFEELKEDDGKNNTALAIVRPPMIYGKNSKGNFKMLVKLADKEHDLCGESRRVFMPSCGESEVRSLSAAECFLRDHGTDGSSDCYGKREKRTSV